MLNWPTIDARVIDISDEDAAIKGLIENLQRADLTPSKKRAAINSWWKPL